MMGQPTVILDDAKSARLLRFPHPLAIIRADAPADLEQAFAQIEAALSAGKHVAGYFSYELGYLLEARLLPLLPTERRVPLLWLGVFDAPVEADANAVLHQHIRGRAYAGPLQHEWSEPAYAARFRRVHAFIEAGDIYQANLSFRSRFAFVGDPLALYAQLRARSAAHYCAYVDDGERQILSQSPELFFAISGDGRIVAKPMKGTTARGDTPAADAAARAHLRTSDKERAENLMIVDLLRNDIGRIAETGSVTVDELFAVETYPTLHQMVSTVSAQLKSGTKPRDIVRALFPCGSITGAPKIRAMEVIAELEASPRGVYCGAIGHFAPDGSASFNVAIRTLTIADGQGALGIGGAVVYDSRAEAEYAECRLKARYFESARQTLELIETLRWSPSEGFLRLGRHLARMSASAESFGIPFDLESATSALTQAVANGSGALRVRLLLSEAGELNCTVAPLPSNKREWRYTISSERVLSQDVLLRHKTSRRELFDAEHARAITSGYDEVVFLNERGEITEGSRTNVFARIHGELVTPPLDCGLLNGCLRQELIETGQCSERVLVPPDLEIAQDVWFGNSLRGLIPAIR
jgi:para-aminobenzoate synthetase/4-amino-4-deoxychorismate lyase